MSVTKVIDQFVSLFNAPGSDVYPVYGEAVDWIEMPTGRSGGRDELFAALKQSRDFFSSLQLTPLSITADDNGGVLESEITLTAPDGNVTRARTVWIFGVEGGKIVKEHDYSLILK